MLFKRNLSYPIGGNLCSFVCQTWLIICVINISVVTSCLHVEKCQNLVATILVQTRVWFKLDVNLNLNIFISIACV